MEPLSSIRLIVKDNNNTMEECEMLTPYSEFKFWFVRKDARIWEVTDLLTGEVTEVAESNIAACDPSMAADFSRFSTRPEYLVGHPEIKDMLARGNSREVYLALLRGCALIRARRNGRSDPDACLEKLQPCISWLQNTDFFTCPASTSHHDSYEGGLVDHSLRVVINAYEFMNCNFFKDVKYEDATLCALVHDWCKIEFYEQYMKNVKNEATGKWEAVPAYRYRENEMVPLGHGVSSLYLAQRFFCLSLDECLAIRWHMGAWSICYTEQNELRGANAKYPLVQLLQFADQMSINEYAQ